MEESSLSFIQVLLLALLIVWSAVWKAIALWQAAGKKDLAWFIAIFILNTAGILEIFYIFIFSKRSKNNAQ